MHFIFTETTNQLFNKHLVNVSHVSGMVQVAGDTAVNSTMKIHPFVELRFKYQFFPFALIFHWFI